jgi:uncharacterized low-complexity protein
MSKKSSIKPLAFALGAAFATTLSSTAVVNAASNPFEMTELSGGYLVTAAAEGKCGGNKANEKSDAEAKCGANKTGDKAGMEGKCGASKTSDKTGKEGKCGEGKCGANKATHKASKEGKCGGNK